MSTALSGIEWETSVTSMLRDSSGFVVEPFARAMPRDQVAEQRLIADLTGLAEKFPHTSSIRDFLFHPNLPVDIRHNAKIFREKLVPWAERELRCRE